MKVRDERFRPCVRALKLIFSAPLAAAEPEIALAIRARVSVRQRDGIELIAL